MPYESDHLRCVVERITYQNAENGYTVIKCKAKGYQDLVTVIGNMPDVHVGSVLSLGGFWKIDGKYGRQFSVLSFEETLPATVYGIEKYLGSGLVKGIGPKFAKRIVNQFGADTLEVIETDPDRLLEINGIGKVRVERIKKSWAEQKEIKNIMLFLQSHDVSTSHATKIYKTYGAESIATVQQNPYRLADDIWGIGFKTADTIASKLGFGPEKYERLRSGLLYTLNQLSDQGHCYATREQLQQTGAQLLGVDESLLSMTLDEMIRVQDVILDEDAIYLPPFFYAETGTARRLMKIFDQKDERIQVPLIGLEERISYQTRMHYDEIQMEAIRTAVQSKIMILTGGPGTGKTTTTQGILAAFRSAGAKILLAAPTGRAAKRLSETTRMEAKTIHRLLEVKPPEGYTRNEENPLEGDVLIVDECSMIDIMLMYNLLKAVPDNMILIFVGDVDQLPSVGAGNVLRDMIDSECFPVVRLARIFRQAASSRIIMNAHRINAGKMPDISNGRQSDFFFIEIPEPKEEMPEGPVLISDRNIQSMPERIPTGAYMAAEELAVFGQTPTVVPGQAKVSDGGQSIPANGGQDQPAEDPAEKAVRLMVDLVKRRLPKAYHISPWDIQVLTPMQRSVVGAANLNQALQTELNPAGEGLRRGGIMYRVHDKVMQIRNNYDKEVFNGDIGVISSVDLEERELTVRFDERDVTYDISELDELVLAYATTIHKAQGSEYPIVVMPVMMNHFVMLQKNLIYTGVTRAKKVLVMVGTKKALAYAVHHVTVTERNTLLKERLQGKRTVVLPSKEMHS